MAGRGGGGRYPNTGTTTDTPHGEDLLNITEVFKKTTPPSTEILKPLSGSTEHDMDWTCKAFLSPARVGLPLAIPYTRDKPPGLLS